MGKAYLQPTTNQCRHSDAYFIAPSAPFRRRACCKRYALQIKVLINANNNKVSI